MRLVSRRFSLLLVALAVGCAPPVHDVDGLPVERPALLGSAPGARLVVDSTPQGWRALAELHGTRVISASLSTLEPVPELRCDDGHAFSMVRVRQGAGWCRDAVAGDPDAPSRYGHPPRGPEECFRQLVVEYRLGHPPTPEEVWTLATGETLRAVRWKQP